VTEFVDRTLVRIELGLDEAAHRLDQHPLLVARLEIEGHLTLRYICILGRMAALYSGLRRLASLVLRSYNSREFD
jgi:hypothetical protein